MDNHDGNPIADGSTWDGFPPSNVQVKRPNRKNQDQVWGFIASCPNLESLAVHGTHHLDLDRQANILSQRAQSILANLRVLALSRVYVSARSLQRLLPRRNIRRVILSEAKMRGAATWADCFAFLRRACPSLDFTYVTQLTYFEAHTHFTEMHIPGEDIEDIWTGNTDDVYGDEVGYQNLLRKLCRRAGGKDRYPGGGDFDWFDGADDDDNDDDEDDDSKIDGLKLLGLGSPPPPPPQPQPPQPQIQLAIRPSCARALFR